MKKFKNFIQKTLILFVSREFAFLYCVFGTIAQVAHTYYLTSGISSIEGNGKVIQAVMLSTFISTSLLYFISVSDDKHTTKSTNVRMAVLLFMWIEIIINLYYYSRHLIVEKLNPTFQGSWWDNIVANVTVNNWFDFFFAIIISCLIPVTIKLYSSHIRAKEWIEEMTKKDSDNISTEDYKTLKEKLFLEVKADIINEGTKELQEKNNSLDEEINAKMNNIDKLIKDSFEKNSTLFINQFNNKLKTQLKNEQ